ncbi:MAG: hypothetical protein Q8P20_02230 [bacterium]|nr:hypothetical protein [bacterium]
MFKKVLLVVLIILLVLFQIGFLKEFTSFSKYFNLVLIIAIFLTFTSEFNKPLIFTIITGFILEFNSLYLFGTYTLSLLLTIFFIKYLSNKYINQKTYYSLLIITIVGTIAYNLFIIISINFSYIFNFNIFSYNINSSLIKDILFQLLFHSVTLSGFLYIKRLFNYKLKSKVYLKNSNE